MNIHSSAVHNSQKAETMQTSSAHPQINEMWSVHTMEYFSYKKNETLINATVWMNLENIMGSEGSQTQKATFYML